ncbi:MAG: flagellar hook-basal body complex protein [Desulfobacter sp.]|nr:MAG: flagellar hook-basal body complex protein [Desulfobacter sp.]
MSLSSSLFTGTSGLKNMGNALQVVGNNISNLNTIGFKKGRTTFADTLYESVATQAGTAQMGRGMAVGSVTQNFSQGSFESTGNTTDLSIGGDGFFIVRQSGTENTYYTRAGNFNFDEAGQLVNPEGYIVQGWELDEETGDDVGSITDLILEEFTSPPKKSSEITAITNLDADSSSNSVVLSNLWDAGETTQMSSGNYEYQTVVKVYDSLGSTHDITIFYDKKSGTEWEYVITMNPEEDNRNLVQGTDSQGLLARGTITFSQSSGDVLQMTMEEFTGRVGNISASGVNTVDEVHFEIDDSAAALLDGYGFSLEFDGSSWNFTDQNGDGLITAADLPDNYPDAKIVYSDNKNIHITLDPDDALDTEPDLRIKLDQPAVATDSVGFDINDANDLHVQSIEGAAYSGDTANDNTTLEINDPGVMTHDAEDLGLIWNPLTEEWTWSNPAIAADQGTLVSDMAYTDGLGNPVSTTAAGFVTVNNAEDVTMYAEDLQLRYDGSSWDWNDDLKSEDITSTFNFSPQNDPVLSIESAGSEGAIYSGTAAGLPSLYWMGDHWSLSTAGTVTTQAFDNTTLAINTSASSSTNVIFDLYVAGTAGASTLEYTFGSALSTAAGQSISFQVDPTPPREYSTAVLYTTAASAAVPADGFAVDFDADNTLDITFDPALSAAPANGSLFSFTTDPDVPPEPYQNATLTGDQTQVVIDLDGSGSDDDKEDIVFTFTDPLKYGTSTHPYTDRSTISFDISGSTAWSDISTDEIKNTGYFAFTADFLGGEFGTTENDIELNIGSRFDGTNFINDSLSTTQYSKSSSTVFQDADGYAAGDLQGVDVASDGVITGIYSNGQLIPLFRVGLAEFQNNYGLSNEGGNLFSETRESGTAITNKPGENGLGTISPNSLEMSNVDVSEEFVSMIVQQRGFQANSKIVTTVDEMMNTVISMKR